MTRNKVYLGDSVYAETEDGVIKLYTCNGEEEKNTIWIEDEVAVSLADYLERFLKGDRK